MRYLVMTEVSPEDVLARARSFFANHTRMALSHEESDSVTFTGELGRASFRVDREHGHTNVHAETDRGVGFDVTDLTKRFLYTLGHV